MNSNSSGRSRIDSTPATSKQLLKNDGFRVAESVLPSHTGPTNQVPDGFADRSPARKSTDAAIESDSRISGDTQTSKQLYIYLIEVRMVMGSQDQQAPRRKRGGGDVKIVSHLVQGHNSRFNLCQRRFHEALRVHKASLECAVLPRGSSRAQHLISVREGLIRSQFREARCVSHQCRIAFPSFCSTVSVSPLRIAGTGHYSSRRIAREASNRFIRSCSSMPRQGINLNLSRP